MENESIKYTACPLCESSDIRPLISVNCTGNPMWQEPLEPEMVWVTCGACEHIFTDGYFTQEALNIIFRNAPNDVVVGTNVEQWRNMSAKMVERVINKIGLPEEGRTLWLDIGFGNGSLLMTAQEFGFDVYGADMNEKGVSDIRKLSIPAYFGSIADLVKDVNFEQSPMVISMADVVEHEPFPQESLRSARELIDPSGVLLISMPNAGAPLWQHWNETNANPYWHNIGHYHNFTRKHLYSLLRATGFEPVHYNIAERYRCCMEVLARPVETTHLSPLAG